MASTTHDFIVAAIVRKMRIEGFQIVFLDGRYANVSIKKYEIPPTIINHKPDVIGEKEGNIICIGEAKTGNDLFSERTKNQIKDFILIIKKNPLSRLILGIPLSSKNDLDKLLYKIGLSSSKQIEIFYVPEELFPNEENL